MGTSRPTNDKGGEVVERDLDAMIGHAVLWKIIGANFLTALSGADLGPAMSCVAGVFFGNFTFEQAGAKDGEGAGFVLLLRALIGATDNQAGWFVDDLNG